MATRTPGLQERSRFHAYWGVYATTSVLPNASGAPLASELFALEVGDTAYVTDLGPVVCADAGGAGLGDAIWTIVEIPVIETEPGTARSMTNSDNNKIIRFTAGTTITWTVPAGLEPGVTVELVQEGAGQIQVVGSGVSIRKPATFNPYTNEQYSSLVVTALDTDEALVRGDMAAA